MQFLPNQHFGSIIMWPEFAGADHIIGGDHDDILLGQEMDDTIEGGNGSDDIWGGHNRAFGHDGNDTLHGNGDDDVILGDNGAIMRETNSFNMTEFPWTVHSWKPYPAPFDTEIIRDVLRFDDIDLVQGDDEIYGGEGNDIIHGQRGDDELHGGTGDDELYGELGQDRIYGDQGHDILIGDIGYCIRRYSDTSPLGRNNKPDVWHKDVVLEELGNITSIARISQKLDVQAMNAESIAAASLLFVAHAHKEDGTKYLDPATGEWITDLFTFNLEESYNDYLHGGDGDDGKLI